MRVLSLMLGLLVVVLAMLAGIAMIDSPFADETVYEAATTDLGIEALATGTGSDEQSATARLIEVIELAGTQFTVNDNHYLNHDPNLLGRKCSPDNLDGVNPGTGLGTGGRWSASI